MFKRIQQSLGLQVIPQIFFVSAATALAFVVIAVLFRAEVAGFFGTVTEWVYVHLGWFYVLSVSGLLGFLIWVALSRYGSIKLGPADVEPDYSFTTWFTMLFAAGIGTILMFWGVAEPISHFAEPPLEGVEGKSRESAELAMSISLYHFGLHTWTIFTMPALAIGYFAYRHGLPMRISSLFYPLLGKRIYGPIGWVIDIIAVLGTLFGVATSVGLGTLQLNSGLNHLFGMPTTAPWQVGIIVVITAIATISVALGLDRGIRRLSQINILLAVALLLFVWIVGPTLFVTAGMVEVVGGYLRDMPWLAFWTETFQGTDWQQSWTVFYWAWTISWAPYVGIFIARISRGRSIREFVGGALGAPTLFTLIWFSVLGLSGIHQELMEGVDLSSPVADDVAVALFTFLQHYPLAMIASAVGVIIIVIFLTTSADSASLVIDLLSRRDDQKSLVRQRVFWAIALGAVAATLLLADGFDALQNVITTLGLPFCALLVFMAVALARALKADWHGRSIEEGPPPKPREGPGYDPTRNDR